MTQAPHAPTHMNNPKITRNPLPAMLPTILPAMLTGLFILVGCGGSALPIPVIATESTDAANKAESTAPDSIFLSVGEQPPVDTAKSAPPADTPAETPIVQVQKQEEVKKQVQAPAPVFEVAVAPARPPERSFSQAEPQVSTDFVPRSDATGQSHADDGVVTFADWVDDFTTAPPTRATTTTTTTTPNTINKYNGGLLVTFTDKSLVNKVGDTILTYTSEVLKANGEPHADGDRIAFTTYDDDTTNDGHIIVVSRDGIPRFSESELAYIAANAKFNGDIPVTMDNPLTTISGTRNQFLQGLRGSLDERPREGDPDGQVAIRGSLSLATATNNGIALGGDAADGVAFFRGFGAGTVINEDTKSTTGHNYAGLYSGTDLGKPLGLTFRGETSATWKGHIRTLGYFNFDTDIDLIVNFGTKRLTVREFTNPTNADEHLSIAARYTGDGVISGTIIIDADGAGFGIEDEYGFVTGLIGAQGAVAAFLSSGYNSQGGRENIENAQGTKENIDEGDHQFGYAGGFVARPAPLPDVDASDLLNYASIPTTIAGLAGDSRFLRIADDARIDTTGITSPAENPNLPPAILTIRRDYTAKSAGFGDGYAFIHPQGYTAILPTTDLGLALPINAGQLADAEWEGTYSLTHSALNAPITFIVDFTTGALTGTADIQFDDAFHLVGKTITIDATFGADGVGVLDGTFKTEAGRELVEGDTPLINAVNTDVIGLIGAEGLVGIMHGQNTNGDVFAGGFIADAPPPPTADYEAWLESFGGPLLSAARNADIAPVSQFLQSGPDAINAGNVANATIKTLKMADSNNGVSFLQGTHQYAFRTVFFAGILSGTDMGVSLPPYTAGDTAEATWNGKIQWVGSLDNNLNGQVLDMTGREAIAGSGADARAFQLTVNFQNSTIEAFVPMGDNSHHLLLEAGYNAKGQFTNGRVEYGVFAGGVKEGARTASNTNDSVFGGPLTGVIGQNGAVGVFISDPVSHGGLDYGFAGGFVAAPD